MLLLPDSIVQAEPVETLLTMEHGLLSMPKLLASGVVLARCWAELKDRSDDADDEVADESVCETLLVELCPRCGLSESGTRVGGTG